MHLPPSLHDQCSQTRTTNELQPPSQELSAQVLALHGVEYGNDLAMRLCPAFNTIEKGSWGAPDALGSFPLKACAWNMQQGHFPKEAIELLQRSEANLLLLSELDMGLNRTVQICFVRDLARILNMNYVFAPEFQMFNVFQSVGKNQNPNSENDLGYHGNAVLFAGDIRDSRAFYLDEEADWFNASRTGEPRVGRRVALAAKIDISGETLVCVSVHLESDCDPGGCVNQVRTLLENLSTYSGNTPVLIGGDFNAGARTSFFDWRNEGFFTLFEEAGFTFRDINDFGPTSRKSRIANAAIQESAKYDWFFAKGIRAEPLENIAALDCENQPISDHDAICIKIEGFAHG